MPKIHYFDRKAYVELGEYQKLEEMLNAALRDKAELEERFSTIRKIKETLRDKAHGRG